MTRFDAEKDRRQRLLRAMVTDPSADFTALAAEEFHALLKAACTDGLTSPNLVAETVRRAAELGAREVQLVLLAAEDRAHWMPARAVAMASAVADPAVAVAAVNLEIQRLGLPSVQVQEGVADGKFTARAALTLGDRTVEGGWRRRTAKKAARQAATLSLLAVLAGWPEPAEEAPGEEAGPGRKLAADGQEIELWLDHEATRPRPDPALLELILGQTRLSVRSLYLLLLVADREGWAAARRVAWGVLARTPASAQGVLSLHTQAGGRPPIRYVEAGATAVAFAEHGGGVVVGEPCTAASPKAAKAGAALSLLADLVGEVEAAEIAVRADNPVGELNERAQVGAITPPVFEMESSGPSHQPVFTVTVSCGHPSGMLRESCTGGSKAEAKAAAAAALLAVLAQVQSRARVAAAFGAVGIVGRMLRAGCVLDYADGLFVLRQADGGALPDLPLPAPLTDGWAIPLAPMLPVLATLEGGDESARGWAALVRRGLEAVAAGEVCPAMDEHGRDQWQVVGSEHYFLDDLAELLLRPPGARLLVGDVPYAGTVSVLDGPAALWADECAEQADPAPAATVRLRIHLPGEDGMLRAVVLGITGHAGHRAVRRGARLWAPLRRGLEFTLTGEEAAGLLGPVGAELTRAGVRPEWPQSLVTSLGSGVSLSSGENRAELRWELELDGRALTEEEREAVAAGRALLKLRDRWVLIDAETLRRAQRPSLGELPAGQALGAALTGEIAVEGELVSCRAAGRLAEIVSGLRGSTDGRLVAVPDGLQATLRDYQHRAVGWLDRLTGLGFGALLADDMGLGKTLTVIAFHLHRKAGPALVVCPASLLVNWEREFARFAPDVPVRRYHGAGRSLDDLLAGEVVITTYGTLLRDAPSLAGIGWDLVVADEAQHVKNERSQAARALRTIPASVRLAVTGTPVENSLSELWAILDWTNPGLFGTLPAFREQFGKSAEKLAPLIGPFLLRRRKSDPAIAPELPDKVVSDRIAPLSTEQAGLYRAVTEDILGRIEASTGIARSGQVLKLLQALRQICNSPAHYLRTSAQEWDADREAARSGKLAALDELLEAVDEPALLFTGYVSMGHLLHAHLAARGITASFLHGSTPTGKRQEMVDAFQEGHGDVLILSVRAAGTGLNLTRAGHVIHFDRPWNPAVEDQATDRAHRIGQHRTVQVHHLIAEGTVEDRIADMLARKRALASAVLTGGERALGSLGDEELRALVSLGRAT